MEFDPIPIGSCSKQQQAIYKDWFNYADSGTVHHSTTCFSVIFVFLSFLQKFHGTLPFLDSDGRITGSDATKFFAMSNLSRQDLKQVFCFPVFLCCRCFALKHEWILVRVGSNRNLESKIIRYYMITCLVNKVRSDKSSALLRALLPLFSTH